LATSSGRKRGFFTVLSARRQDPFFFGNGLGFLAFSVGWPLVHMLVLIVIYTVTGRAAPYGDSLVLFFATGLVPMMTFMYMSRWIMIGLVLNRRFWRSPSSR
jgi:capsular polysaccharide transport system permease protein